MLEPGGLLDMACLAGTRTEWLDVACTRKKWLDVLCWNLEGMVGRGLLEPGRNGRTWLEPGRNGWTYLVGTGKEWLDVVFDLDLLFVDSFSTKPHFRANLVLGMFQVVLTEPRFRDQP